MCYGGGGGIFSLMGYRILSSPFKVLEITGHQAVLMNDLNQDLASF